MITKYYIKINVCVVPANSNTPHNTHHNNAKNSRRTENVIAFIKPEGGWLSVGRR